MKENPYATPQAQLDGNALETEEVRIRHKYLSREASIYSIGFIFCLAAIFIVLCGAGLGIQHIKNFNAYQVLAAIVVVGLGVFMFFIGLGLRLLQPWSKLPAGIYAILCLGGGLANPAHFLKIFGVIASFYVIGMIYSHKGEMVFSDRYEQIIFATRHIKYRTSIVLWIFFFRLVSLVGFFMVALVLSGTWSGTIIH